MFFLMALQAWLIFVLVEGKGQVRFVSETGAWSLCELRDHFVNQHHVKSSRSKAAQLGAPAV